MNDSIVIIRGRIQKIGTAIIIAEQAHPKAQHVTQQGARRDGVRP